LQLENFQFQVAPTTLAQRTRQAGSLHQIYRYSLICTVKPMTICSTASSTTVTKSYIISFLHRHRRHNTTPCDPGDTICNFLQPLPHSLTETSYLACFKWTHTDFINWHLTLTANRPNTPTNLCILKSFKPTIYTDIILSYIIYAGLPTVCKLLRFVTCLINGSNSSSSSSSSSNQLSSSTW